MPLGATHAKVGDAMRAGVVSCPPDTPLREVAGIMVTYRIHCVVVADTPDSPPLGVVRDIDLMAFASAPDEPAAGIARTRLITVKPDDALASAAQLMAEHDVTHLVVLEARTGRPAGILSALDVAGALAWGTE